MIIIHLKLAKSNLIRILKRIIASPSNGFSTSYLEDDEKFDQNKGSSIRIGIKFSQTESCLISRLVFRNTEGKFQNGEFILSWDGRRWNQIIKYALILQNKLIIWHDGRSSKFGIIPNGQNRDKLFEYLYDIRTMTNAEIDKRKEKKDNLNAVIQDKIFQNLLFDNPSQCDEYFRVNAQQYVCPLFTSNSVEELDRPIYEYCELEFNRNRIDLWILLAEVFIRNFILIDEFRHPVESLKTLLTNIKANYPDNEFRKLRDRFS